MIMYFPTETSVNECETQNNNEIMVISLSDDGNCKLFLKFIIYIY